MTLAQQLEQKGLQQGLQQGIEQGKYRKAIAIAKNLLNDGTSPQAVQRLTGLSEKEVMELA